MGVPGSRPRRPPPPAPLALATNDLSPTRTFLASLLASRQERLSRWALLATTTPDTADTMTVVGRGLRSADRETRAQAVKALESMGVHAVTRSLIPLLEDTGHGALPDSRTSLREMSEDHDEWIRALAVRCISEELIDDLGHLRGVADADNRVWSDRRSHDGRSSGCRTPRHSTRWTG